MKTEMKYQIVGPASCGVLAESNSIEELKNDLLEMHEIDEQEYEKDAETGLFVDDDEEAPYTITEWDGEDYQTVCTLRVNEVSKDMDLQALMGQRECVVEELPRRRKRTQENIATKKAMEEKREMEMVHKNPIWHPLYELGKQTAGNLLDIRDSLKVQEDDIKALLAQINVCRKPSELNFRKNAFSGAPINDEVDSLKHKLKNALEKELYQLDKWRETVEDELSKRTGDQDWRRTEAEDYYPDC